MKTSESQENYLKAILLLSKKIPNVRAVDVAEHMNFSKASVSIALKRLCAEGYVTVDHGSLSLTDTGYKIAATVMECHSYFEQLLLKAGVSREQAHMDACKIEHAISNESYEALKIHDRSGIL